MRSWKEYQEKRAAEIRKQLTDAIKNCDTEAFKKVYYTSFNYLKASERKNWYKTFISNMAN